MFGYLVADPGLLTEEQFGRYRACYCARLAEYAAAAHGECSGGKERLTLRYETVSGVSDPL